MPNAAVLPEPVRDWTIRSRPWMMRGYVAACTGIGSEKPISSTARSTSAWRPSSAKEGTLGPAASREGTLAAGTSDGVGAPSPALGKKVSSFMGSLQSLVELLVYPGRR